MDFKALAKEMLNEGFTLAEIVAELRSYSEPATLKVTREQRMVIQGKA